MGDWSVVPEASDWSVVPDAPKSARPSDLPLRGMRPAVAPDEGGDLLDSRGGGRLFLSKAERHQAAEANNPLKDDLIGQAIVGGAMTAPLGVVAGGAMRAIGAPALAPLASGAIQGAGMNPEHPLTGAVLGAIPGVPTAARGADLAIGRKALDIATAPATTSGPVASLARKATERAVHAVVGHSMGGVPGLIASQAVSPLIHDATAAVGNKIVGKLANRYLRQTGGEEALSLVKEFEDKAAAPSGRKVVNPADVRRIFGDDVAVSEPPISAATAPKPIPKLAPLVQQPQQPLKFPPGYNDQGQFLDEISGEQLTNGGRLPPPATNQATHGGATNPGGRRLQILDENGQDLLSPTAAPSLRADVSRDAASYLRSPVEEAGGDISAPYGAPGGGGPPDVKSALGDQLANSVRLFDELRAGKITAQQAIDAGLPPGIVAKAAQTGTPGIVSAVSLKPMSRAPGYLREIESSDGIPASPQTPKRSRAPKKDSPTSRVFHGTSVLGESRNGEWISGLPRVMRPTGRIYVAPSSDLAARYANAQASGIVDPLATRLSRNAAVVEFEHSGPVKWLTRESGHNTLDLSEANVDSSALRPVRVHLSVDRRYIDRPDLMPALGAAQSLAKQLGIELNITVAP